MCNAETVDIERIRMDAGWKEQLFNEFQQPYFSQIKYLYKEALRSGVVIYPPPQQLFHAFVLTPFEEVKVIILGQDPYHRKGQAMGLSFSVPKGVTIPPSLKNIYRELVRSYNMAYPVHGDLTSWAKQGVLLLNTALTVEEGKPNSHKDWGWTFFTDAVIACISNTLQNCVFLLWGRHARDKRKLIDFNKHCVLESVHPSPLTGDAFVGNAHFLQANAYLEQHGRAPIRWDSVLYT